MNTTKTTKTGSGEKAKVTVADVTAVLAAHPDVTAAEVADRLGIGQSTAAKHLAGLETSGAVRRTPGGRDGGRRVADRWSLPPAVSAVPAGEDGSKERGEATTAPGREGRFAPGELAALVQKYLTDRPDEDLGPTQVCKGLGHSRGAVAYSLARLAELGQIRVVATAPLRYRAA